jgi:uncharacterized protein (DUF58 family)
VPTREGTTVLLLAVALFFMATNLMAGLLFVLDALLVSLLGTGMVTALLPLRGITVRRRAPARATEGVPFAFDLTLVSPRGGRFITIEDGWEGARARALVADLPAGTPTTCTLTVTPPRRGLYQIGPAEIASRGTVGLLLARRRVDTGDRVAVWPRVYPVPAQALEFLAPALDGRAEPVRTREAEDFYGLRDYRPGDSLARIAWRTSARRGALVVREFERTRMPGAAVVLDLDRRQAPHRLDAAARAAASLFVAARDRGLTVVLAGWARGPVEHRDWEAAMDWLAGVAPDGPPLADVLPHLEGASRTLIAVASRADVPLGRPAVVPVLPADDVVAHQAAWRGLVYTPDGMVQAW